MSYSARRQVAVSWSVSSASQAARASPSRGWPVDPGLISHSPAARSTWTPSRRVVPLAGSPSGRWNDSATCEWPMKEIRWSVASKHSSAASADRTYSQIGSRGEAWKSPRSEEHTSELQSQSNLVCRLLLEKKKNEQKNNTLYET